MLGGHFCVTSGLRAHENRGSFGLKQTQRRSWDLNAGPPTAVPMLVTPVLPVSSASDLLTSVSPGSLPAGAAQLPNARHGRSAHCLLNVGTTGGGFPKSLFSWPPSRYPALPQGLVLPLLDLLPWLCGGRHSDFTVWGLGVALGLSISIPSEQSIWKLKKQCRP